MLSKPWMNLFAAATVICSALAQDKIVTTHIVTVGKAAHRFDPDSLAANVGDIIEFQFYPTNHSVIRSAFASPCIPYGMVTPMSDTFFSGFRPVKTFEKNPPTYRVTVNDTEPIFYYCSAPDSCNYWGMVGVVNPRNDTPLSVHRQNALKASYVLQLGDPWPNESDNITPKPSKASESVTNSVSETGSSTPSITPANIDAQAVLSPSAITAVALGGAALIALVCGFFIFLSRKRPARSDNPPTISSNVGEKPSDRGSHISSPPQPPPPSIPIPQEHFNHPPVRASYGSTIPYDPRYSHDYMSAGPTVPGDPLMYYPPPSSSPPLMGMGGFADDRYKPVVQLSPNRRPVEMDTARENENRGPGFVEGQTPSGRPGELFLGNLTAQQQGVNDAWSSSTAAAPSGTDEPTYSGNPQGGWNGRNLNSPHGQY